MVFLTSVDRKELNSAVVEYLKSQNVSSNILSSVESHLLSNANINNTDEDSSSSLLEKRWSTFKRVTLANAQLEEKVKKLEAELINSKNPFASANSSCASSSSQSTSLQQQQHQKQILLLPAGPSPLHQFKGHRDRVTSIAIHPLEPVIISGSLDGTIRVWNMQTRKQIQKITVGGESVNCISIEPTTGEMFAVAIGNISNNNNFDAQQDGQSAIGIYEMVSSFDGDEMQNNNNNNNNDDDDKLDLLMLGGESAKNPFEYVCTKNVRQITSSLTNGSSPSSSEVEDISSVGWCGSNSKDGIENSLLLITCSNSGSINIWDFSSSSSSSITKNGKSKKRRSNLVLEANVNNSFDSDQQLVRKISCCSGTLMTKNIFVAVGCSDQSIFMLNVNKNFDTAMRQNSISSFCGKNTAQSPTCIHTNAITCLSFINHPTGENILVEKYATAERRAERREWVKNISSSSSSVDDKPQYLISSSRDKNVVLSELKYSNATPSSSSLSVTIVPIWKFEGHGGWVNHFTLLMPTTPAVGSEGTSALYVATTSDDDTIRIIDLVMKKEVRRVTDNCNGGNNCLSVAPLSTSSKLILCSGGTDKLISVWGFKE